MHWYWQDLGWDFAQICNRVMAFDWCQFFCFLSITWEKLLEFYQILYMHWNWQDLSWDFYLSLFAKLLQRYGPWSMSDCTDQTRMLFRHWIVSTLIGQCSWAGWSVSHSSTAMTSFKLSLSMRFPTMWYVRPAKHQTSLRISAVWSEPLQVAWIFYECWATDWTPFGVSKL